MVSPLVIAAIQRRSESWPEGTGKDKVQEFRVLVLLRSQDYPCADPDEEEREAPLQLFLRDEALHPTSQ